MKNSKENISKDIFSITVVILMSIFFVFLVFPVLINLECIKIFLNIDIWGPFVAVTALVFIFLICSWEKMQELWQRYENTRKLKKRLDYSGPDYIVLFIVFSALFIIFLPDEFIPERSSNFKFFAKWNCFFILGWFFSSYFWKKRERKADVFPLDNYSLIDEPIKFTDQDLLGREDFIENLYQDIIKLPFDDSFVFGLNGKWGEGKTSVVNLLRDKIEKNDDFLVVNFNPWYF